MSQRFQKNDRQQRWQNSGISLMQFQTPWYPSQKPLPHCSSETLVQQIPPVHLWTPSLKEGAMTSFVIRFISFLISLASILWPLSLSSFVPLIVSVPEKACTPSSESLGNPMVFFTIFFIMYSQPRYPPANIAMYMWYVCIGDQSNRILWLQLIESIEILCKFGRAVDHNLILFCSTVLDVDERSRLFLLLTGTGS